MMAFGFSVLRLSPRDFWTMTPRELRAAASAFGGTDAPGRAELDRLMARFPDRKEGSDG